MVDSLDRFFIVKRGFPFSLQHGSDVHYFPVFLLVLYSVIGISPYFNFIGLRPVYVSCLVFFACIACFVFKRCSIEKWAIILIATLIVLCVPVAIYWMEPKLFFISFFLVTGLLLFSLLTHAELEFFVELSSKLLLLVLIGSVIGFFLVKSGLLPVGEFQNPDRRRNYFFLTTFTNTYSHNFIRPSGIYDEPGALSCIVCLVVFLRRELKQDEKLSWVLLVLGLITLSIMHAIFLFFI